MTPALPLASPSCLRRRPTGLGVDVADRRRMIRADNAKLNLAPPPEETVWLRLCSVDIGNAEPMKGLAGDSVQAVERWSSHHPHGRG